MASRAASRIDDNKSIDDNKKLRFDEDNIRLTNHPVEKDYGLMSIPESKTPYPRHADPVEAKELRKRLQSAIERANMMLHANSDDYNNSSDSISLDAASRVSNPFEDVEEDRERQHAEFLKKRKQFYQSEFLITRQKRLCAEIHPPGPSVGSNWRIEDGDENPSTPSLSGSPARITSIISRNRLPLPGSLVNQETLREITEQMSRFSPSLQNN